MKIRQRKKRVLARMQSTELVNISLDSATAEEYKHCRDLSASVRDLLLGHLKAGTLKGVVARV